MYGRRGSGHAVDVVMNNDPQEMIPKFLQLDEMKIARGSKAAALIRFRAHHFSTVLAHLKGVSIFQRMQTDLH